MSEYFTLGLLVNYEHLDQSLFSIKINVAKDSFETAQETITETDQVHILN